MADWPWPKTRVFTRDSVQWSRWIAGLMDTEGVTDLHVFGDWRPLHREAVLLARLRGLHVWAYDEGYLRPDYITMREELFGPVLTVYVYEPDKMEETLDLVDTGSAYALTGAIFSNCRANIERLTERLTHTAGNFYINDKPTGAVVDQQPFGGGRASGTNDKAGSVFNLLRWVSPQCIKETFVPATDYMYPNFTEE